MTLEYKTTITDLAPSDLDSFSTDTSVPIPIPPEGIGWKLIQTTSGQRKLYYVWQRGNTVITVSNDYNITSNDDIVLVDATSNTINLLLPNPCVGIHLTIKKIDASTNSVLVFPTIGTIDGMTQKNLTQQYDVLRVATNGSNWFIV